MKKILTIAAKELKTYFQSPIAYIVLIVTICVFNIFFFMIIEQNREATLRDMFRLMEFMFVFIIPILTMKIFAEEKRAGTLEFLMTSPTTNIEIILGKYFGSLIFFTILISITSAYYFIMEAFSNPDKASVLVGYLGIWLEGALFIAIGMLTSSWTKNQIVAAINAYVILLLLYFSISFIKYFDGPIEEMIKYISCWSHLENFSAGLVMLTDLVYFLSGIIFCVMLARISIGNRTWR